MTPQEQTQYIDDLKRDIAILEAWKAHIESEQVDFPLDEASYKVIHADLMLPDGEVSFGLVPYDESVQAVVDGKKYWLFTSKIQ